MVGNMATQVIFMYERLNGQTRMRSVVDLSFGCVGDLLKSAGHIVNSYDADASSVMSYKAFWYDSDRWADPGEAPEAGRILILADDILRLGGIPHLKWLISHDKRMSDFVAYHTPAAQSELHEDPEDGTMGSRIFIVHGHDEATLDSIDHTLRRVGLEPVTFRDFRKGSQTNIEILEAAMPEVDGFICLMTPDDRGRKFGRDKKTRKLYTLSPRARQNVLIEAGYAVLHRRKQSLLIALGGVDVPTDFAGVDLVKGPEWSDDMGRGLAIRLRRMGFTADPAAV